MLIKAPKGTHDILPDEVGKWQYVESVFADVCSCFGYREIRLPVFEHTELFMRGVGDTTDIVQKEMYTFKDKKGRSLTLRPEGTAGLVRSYIEHGMASSPQPVKLYYNITAYRYENVQKGRYREFHQFGVELFGAKSPSADVEIISLLDMFFKRLDIKNLELNLNSVGCPNCRKDYNDKLKKYLENKISDMCSDCQERFDKNPLRILDCKREQCRNTVENTPKLLDYLCEDCKAHFEEVTQRLSSIGISHTINPYIVRGLDYYTKTVFEFVSKNIGSQGTICGGGRYDGLIEACGGKPTPGVGFGMGVERLILEMDSQGIKVSNADSLDIFIGTIGKKAEIYSEKLVYDLRLEGIRCQKDLLDRSLKAQLKYADKKRAKYVIILGDDELNANKARLKDMESGEDKEISLDTLLERLKKYKMSLI